MGLLAKRIVSLAVLLSLMLVAWGWWVARHPPPPVNPHDPFGLGYPDSPEKPEELRLAEQIVIEEWDWAQKVNRRHTHSYSYWLSQVVPDLREGRLMFRSEAERRIYYKSWNAATLFNTAIIQNGRAVGIRAAVQKYILDEYTEGVLGIRPYSMDKPEDRRVLQESGALPPDMK